jgi:methanogenic corrinoid protein MtbC1
MLLSPEFGQTPSMNHELLVEQMFQVLVSGDRAFARKIADTAFDSGIPAEQMTLEIYWPLLDTVYTLYRQDRITKLAQQYATRTLSALIAQAQPRYELKAARNRSICMFCGPAELEDLSGRLVADLIEAEGYGVRFGGGAIAQDDILEELHGQKPDVLLFFASGPKDAPMIRQMIDQIRTINAHPQMQIVVGGGIFNRAPGLAEEIGADLWATDPMDLLDQLENHADVRADLSGRTVGKARIAAA